MIHPRHVLLCLGVGLASPAAAQIVGRPIEASALAGWNRYDIRARMQDGPGYVGTLGWRAFPWLALEGHVLFGPAKADTLPRQAHNLFGAGLDLRMNLRPAEDRAVPYVLVGGAYATSHTSGRPPDKLERGSASLGLGLLYNVLGNDRTYLRLQVRNLFFRERDAREFSNHFATSLGVHFVWRGRPRDSDLDGVREWADRCAETPLGARVDAAGCPQDPDGDRVFSGLDQCEDTPPGCTVDKNGCPSDPDGDGVCDGVDRCAETPRGATVDVAGCPSDPDGDQVFSGLDQCEGTPPGCTVDERGCPADADRDGVCDGVDRCANTPADRVVNAAGCPATLGAREMELLDTGTMRLHDLRFAAGRAGIRGESLGLLQEVAHILQQYPTLEIEVGVHTDDRGDPARNETLSAERATAVAEHLRQNFPAMAGLAVTAKGYGASQPIAPNTSEAGRARNRRVELRVLNVGALRLEREKRLPSAAAPADTTKP